ncbi:TadE/TadG family type IV pilus assembly protein [Rhizobium sp.]
MIGRMPGDVAAKNLFRRFLRDRQGVAAIEFAFMVPLLLVVMLAAMSLYFVFHDAKATEKSTFTVGDIVSRRTTVDTTFLNSSYQMFLRMTNRTDASVKFRISSVKKEGGAYKVVWSYPVAPQKALANADVPVSRLPLLSEGDSLILVETVITPPAINNFLPLKIADYNNLEAVRPRFTSAITKTN